ncbi:hypothetical protein LTS10_000739 [Elasticomyces elasticus]|nr:hypothetical protein LTS10_000739 [Elasticomyces elasticus]
MAKDVRSKQGVPADGRTAKPRRVTRVDSAMGIHTTDQNILSKAPPPQILTLACPDQMQTQMYETLFRIFRPRLSGPREQAHFEFLQTLAGLAQSNCTIRDGLNTFALVQVGAAYDDERLLDASLISYGRAVCGLSKALARPKGLHDDAVLAAAVLLVFCEFFSKIKSSMGWAGHTMGVVRLLVARGPESLQSPLSLWLFHRVRLCSLAISFAQRTANPFESWAWREVGQRITPMVGEIDIEDMIIRVPGLLERCDKLDVGNPAIIPEIDAQLRLSRYMEQDMRDWLQTWHLGMRAQGFEPFVVKDIAEFKAFPTSAEEIRSKFYGLYHVRRNIKRLREIRRSLVVDDAPPVARQVVTDEELDGYLIHLCRCIPCLFEPEFGTHGHKWAFWLLNYLPKDFAAQSNWKWERWVKEAERRCFAWSSKQLWKVEDGELEEWAPPSNSSSDNSFTSVSGRSLYGGRLQIGLNNPQ